MKILLALTTALATLALVACGDSASPSNQACLVKDATGKNIVCIQANSGEFPKADCDALAFAGATVAASGVATVEGSCSSTGKVTSCSGSGTGGTSSIIVYDSSAVDMCSTDP